MSKPRNLKVDLEICNRASKAPWRVATNKHPTTSGNSWGWVEGTRENWCWSNDNKKSYADARFIAQAREGWPHAIKRAIEAESLARELARELEEIKKRGDRLKRDCTEPDKVMIYAIDISIIGNGTLAKAKEVLGDE